MALEDNNGNAISCMGLMVDSLARENQSQVTIETVHFEDCHIHDAMKEKEMSNESINEHEAISEEARQHLYSCNCNPSIETTFERGNGETLLVTFPLSDAKENHPWLDDKEQMKDFLEHAMTGKDHRLLDEMMPAFAKRVGTSNVHRPVAFKKQGDTLH